MSKQKFHKWDLVQVANDLGPMMSHFTGDCRAIVIEVSDGDYGLFLEGEGECWWYEEDQLILIKKKQEALLEKWKKAEEDEAELQGNLDWIFEHGEDVIANGYPYSVEALAVTLGCDNLWGDKGEGFTYYQNARGVLDLALPFLETGDQGSWLSFASAYVQERAEG